MHGGQKIENMYDASRLPLSLEMLNIHRKSRVGSVIFTRQQKNLLRLARFLSRNLQLMLATIIHKVQKVHHDCDIIG